MGLTASEPAATATVASRTIAPKAKSVVFLFQFGGPSHLETFDMKPDAPRRESASPHRSDGDQRPRSA